MCEDFFLCDQVFVIILVALAALVLTFARLALQLVFAVLLRDLKATAEAGPNLKQSQL